MKLFDVRQRLLLVAAVTLLLMSIMTTTAQAFLVTPTVSSVSSPRCSSRLSMSSSEVEEGTTTSTTTTTLDGRKIKGDVKPLNNFLLVKKAEAQQETQGGILLSAKAKIVKTEGTVVSVGPGKTHQDSGVVIDMPVAVGDGVVYGKYDGTELDINGVKHTLIRDDDVLVKFNGNEDLTKDNVEVISDNVLVYCDKSETATEGGILIATSSSGSDYSKPSTGTVVKVGPGRMASNGELMAMEVEVGDNVKFRDYAVNDVTIQDEEYSVVKMADILAKY